MLLLLQFADPLHHGGELVPLNPPHTPVPVEEDDDDEEEEAAGAASKYLRNAARTRNRSAAFPAASDARSRKKGAC